MQRTSFLATDISDAAVASGKRGIYSKNAIRLIAQATVDKYFEPIASKKWLIKTELRKHCMFRRLNLANSPWPFTKKFNVIFCRNLLCYFDTKLQQQLIN